MDFKKNTIRPEKVRLIGKDSKAIGIVNFDEAERIANEENMDLIEVAGNLEVPVYKLGDYQKIKYMEEKIARREAKKQRADIMKTVKINFNEGQHDMETKARRIMEFLNEDKKVKVAIFLSGRERNYFDLGFQKINTFMKLITLPFKFLAEIKKSPTGFEGVIAKEAIKAKTEELNNTI